MKSGTALLRSLGLLGATWMMLNTVPSIGAAKDKDAPPDLSGNWKLNEEMSESLQQRLEESGMGRPPGGGPPGKGGPPGGGPPGMGGAPGMGGGPPMRGGMGGGPSGGDPMRDPIMATMARPPMMMTIEQSESEVLISVRGRIIRTLWLGNEESDKDLEGPEHMRARWKGERLEAHGESAQGRKLQETYRLSKDGTSLIVIAKGDGPGGRSIELERVYDRYEGEPE